MNHSAGLYAQLACIWEATARKAGNVHRLRDFHDLTYLDFLHSAAAIAPVFETDPQRGVGQTVLDSIRATRQVTRTNTNLGMVLLLAPLACVSPREPLRAGLVSVLAGLDLLDSQLVYEAIRLANPGGLGEIAHQDVQQAPTVGLREIMALASERDLIARQYVNGFKEVFELGLPAMMRGLSECGALETAIQCCHLDLLAHQQDSLIARKCGRRVAEEASRQAADVLRLGFPEEPKGREAFDQFDAWLRAEGHRRNPGTSADLVAACLFVALREGMIQLPPQFPWSTEPEHG